MSNSLSIIIPTIAGREQLLRRTLSSLALCEKPSGFSGTFIVENGPKANAETIANSFSSPLRTHYLYVQQSNKSHALNMAMRLVDDGLLVFSDDDTRIHDHTLVAYAKAAAGRHRGQFYGGPVQIDYEDEPPQWLRTFFPPSMRGWSLEVNDGLSSVLGARFLGMNWAAFKQDLIMIGGFDSNFGPGSPKGSSGQESDAERRLILNGVEPVYVPDAKVWHYVQKKQCSPATILRRAHRNGVGRGLRRHVGTGRIPGHGKDIFTGGVGGAASKILGSSHVVPRLSFGLLYGFSYFCGYAKGTIFAAKHDTRGVLPRDIRS